MDTLCFCYFLNIEQPYCCYPGIFRCQIDVQGKNTAQDLPDRCSTDGMDQTVWTTVSGSARTLRVQPALRRAAARGASRRERGREGRGTEGVETSLDIKKNTG